MRCPKCQYLSFDNGNRCRNCGYEFSLAVEAAPLDLAIQNGTEPIGPLADLELHDGAAAAPVPSAVSEPAPETGSLELPLFTPGGKAAPPLVTPLTPRAPLSVRRHAPAPPKPKPSARTRAAVDEPRLALDTAEIPVVRPAVEDAPQRLREPRPSTDGGAPNARPDRMPADGALEASGAPAGARAMAAAIDLTIVGGIDAAVIYLTLRVLELPVSEAGGLPLIPFVAFLLLLNGSYFAAFIAAGGQTIGKMAAGIRVVPGAPGAHAGDRVPVGSAVLRAAAYIVSALPAGVGFLPGLMSSDHRALHDRLADTRVVKA